MLKLKDIKMKFFGKNSLAIAFSLAGVVSSVSALAMATGDGESVHKIHEIEVITSDLHSSSDLAKIFVNIDGDMTDVSIPKSSLKDRAQLEEALADVPEDIREKLLDELGNIEIDANVIKIFKSDDAENGISWTSDSIGQQVFVMEMEDDEHITDIAQKVMKKFKHSSGEKVIEIAHGNGLSAKSIIRLLKQGKYSGEDLDKIQQILDEKR